jgi:hypothetical protein
MCRVYKLGGVEDVKGEYGMRQPAGFICTGAYKGGQIPSACARFAI